MSYWSHPGIEVDHVIPRAAGGPNLVWNLRACHRDCNQLKKHRDLAVVRREIGAWGDVVIARLIRNHASPLAGRRLVEPRVRPRHCRPPSVMSERVAGHQFSLVF